MSSDVKQRLTELERITRGLSPIEKALMIADALQEVYQDEYVIETTEAGGFIIKRNRTNANKSQYPETKPPPKPLISKGSDISG